MAEAVLCVDVGSTFTKGALVDAEAGELLAVAAHPTTLAGDVLEGVCAVRAAVEAAAGRRAGEVLACSSAGGGLRIAVVGYERLVTARAGHRVALTAGGCVVHVHAGPLDGAGLAALRATRPDVVLLTGGTDGGNADVVLHNAGRLARARIAVPVVYAGNADAAEPARDLLAATGRRVAVAGNVLPRIGVLDPQPARAAIRAAFLEHVIGGKRLSREPAFHRMLRGATPDAVLAGVEVLADGAPGVPGAGDVLVVDVGGATTDVYSVVTPAGEDATLPREVVATLWRARTVEGDLGMRWSAPGVLAAARAERLLAEPGTDPSGGPPVGSDAGLDAGLDDYAAACAADPRRLPTSPAEAAADARIAELAVTVALRRHARPAVPAAPARPLGDVGLVVGCGGVLRHGDDGLRRRVLAAAIGDHAGGWKVPDRARPAVDARYALFAAGLLAARVPVAAARLATTSLVPVPAAR
ncbi:MAG TPA: glutamate mutase L [Kineosporiaceae bacterium]